LGVLDLKLSTEVDEDVHLVSSEHFTAEDHLKFIPHPLREAQKLRTFIEGYVESDLNKGCEIWFDSTLVYKLTARPKYDYVGPDRSGSFNLVPYSGTNEVICEKIDYVMEIDHCWYRSQGHRCPIRVSIDRTHIVASMQDASKEGFKRWIDIQL
jgi:hypothetical protein